MTAGNRLRLPRAAASLSVSSLARPQNGVEQITMLCPAASASIGVAVTSSADPSSPWP